MENAEIVKPNERKGGMLKRMFTSLLLLLISYLAVVLVHNLLIALMGKGLGYVVKPSFAGIDMAPKLNRYWGSSRVIALFALPSFAFFLFSLIIFTVLQSRERENSLFRYGLFWLMMWCFLWPVSQLIAAPFSMTNTDNNLNYQGLAVVANWFGIPPVIMIVLGALGVAAVVVMGFVNAGYFLRYIYSLKGKGARNFWLQAMFYLPVIVSLPFSLLFTYPAISQPHLFLSALALFFGAGMSWYTRYRKGERVEKGADVTYRLNFDLLVVLILLALYARFFISV